MRKGWCVGVAGLSVISLAACRDVEAPPVYYQDLGTEGEILVPTASVWTNAAIAQGQADWHAIPEPRVEAATEAPAEAEREAGPGEEPASEAEIRQMVADFNQVAEEGSVEDFLDYFVEEQHGALRPLFESAIQLRAGLSDLRKGLSERLPDARERIQKALVMLKSGVALRMTVDSLSVASESEVNGRLTGLAPASAGEMNVRFSLQDDVWYMELPQIEAFVSATTTSVTAARESLTTWLDELRAGETPPEVILTRVESVAEATAPGRSGTTEETPNPNEAGP